MISCATSSNNCLICTPFTLLVTIIYTKCFFLFSICITTKLSRIDNGNRTEWSSIRSLIIRVINKIWRPRSESPICLITCVITDRIGRHEVLLLVNHNRYNFRENICILLWWKSIWIPNVPNTVQCYKFVHFGKFAVWESKCGCCYGYCDNFCDWWIYLADVTVRLHCPITTLLSATQWLVKDKAVNAPIQFEEIVMGMIKDSTVHSYSWFSHDVTKIQTKKLSLLLNFYFHVI